MGWRDRLVEKPWRYVGPALLISGGVVALLKPGGHIPWYGLVLVLGGLAFSALVRNQQQAALPPSARRKTSTLKISLVGGTLMTVALVALVIGGVGEPWLTIALVTMPTLFFAAIYFTLRRGRQADLDNF
jgi:hypothetical protein